MKHELINFDRIHSNLTACNLLINYVNLIKESIEKQLLTWQMFFGKDVLKDFAIFREKKHVLDTLFNKVAGLQLSCEYCEISKNSLFHKTPPVASSEKFINFPGKHQWRR